MYLNSSRELIVQWIYDRGVNIILVHTSELPKKTDNGYE